MKKRAPKREPKTDAFTFRRFLVKLLQCGARRVRPKPFPRPPYGSIVILAREKLGDAILLTPVFRLIKLASPETTIHVITLGKNGYFYKADPHVDKVFAVKPAIAATVREIRRQRYDVLINTKDHPSFSYLFLTRIIKADFRLGIFHPYHEGFFHQLITMDFHRHVVEKNCSFLTALSIPFDPAQCRPQLPPSPQISSAILRFAQIFNSRKSPRIGINLSAGESVREWNYENWLGLMKRFPGATFVIFSMPGKQDEKVALEKSTGNCVPMPATTTIFDAAEVIKTLDVLVTPDTSFIHVCSCLSIPVVALFRCLKAHISLFSPFMIPHRAVVSSTIFVKDIPLDPVVSATNELLLMVSGKGERHEI